VESADSETSPPSSGLEESSQSAAEEITGGSMTQGFDASMQKVEAARGAAH